MRLSLNFCCLIFLLLSGAIQAQPNKEYVHKLTGDVNSDWHAFVGKNLPAQPLSWTARQVHGFKAIPSAAREQSALSGEWMFYKVDTSHVIGKPLRVTLPHRFENNRDYKSGWYVTKYQLDNLSGKRLMLMLNRVDLFCMVYVNGERIGYHFGSYTPFDFDITAATDPGENTLAIYVYDRSAAVDGDKAYNQLGPEWLKSSYSQGREDKILKGGIEDVPVLEIRENASVQNVFVKTSTRKREMEIEYELSVQNNEQKESVLSFELLKWPDGEKVDLPIDDIVVPQSVNGVQSFKVKWSNPELWSPEHPNLYVLRTTLKNGDNTDVLETRFGFREFWVEGKIFMLNGFPIRLRGESTFRPIGEGIEGYRNTFRLYKELFGSNACRIHAFMPSGDIMKAADEVGVLLIDQSAIWSVNVMFYKNGGDWFLKNTEKEFEEWARRDRNCPSVVIWDVENEMLRYNYELHLPWVSKLPGFIKKYDDTRPFNFSGAGWFSDNQDMASLHMQEHYTRIMKDWNAKGTFPLLIGEFWVGGRMEQRIPTSIEFKSVSNRYLEEAKVYEDKLLEMRYLGVSGLMPFRISMLVVPSINNLQQDVELQIQPEYITQKIKHGLQPVSLFFWPRQNYTDENATFQRELVICNDAETEALFDISWHWENEKENKISLKLLPAEQKRILVDDDAPLGSRKLIATVLKQGELVSTDTLLINPIRQPEKTYSKKIQVYNDEHMVRELANAGIESFFTDSIPQPEDNAILIISEHANNRELNTRREAILTFMDGGGSVLCLKQEQAPSWFPLKFQFWSALQTSPHTYARMGWQGLHKNLFYSKIAPELAQTHPVFKGLNSSSLHLWDKYDGRVSDDVFVRPATLDKYEQGNWRPLANGTRREHVSLAEIFYGKGILLSCQLNVIENLENIQARSLLVNMLNYLSDRPSVPLNKRVAVKGDLSAKGLINLTGVPEWETTGASAENDDLMLAFNGASIGEIKDWASKGGKVIVFSDSLSEAFGGVEISSVNGNSYLATKVADDPVLQGVASANFMNAESALIKRYFTRIPDQARILLQGFEGSNFWRMKDAGPVMIDIPYGKGQIILSTIGIDKKAPALTREFLSLILTNSGVAIPFSAKRKADEITIKKTVPITIDGKLNEWLEDMEDRNVTPYIHAQPVYLTSENIVEGPPEFDLNLSGIDYFLWNENALYMAGVVFGESRTFETGIGYGEEKVYRQNIRLGDDLISVSVENKKANISVNGVSLSDDLVGIGRINSNEITDATLLQFNYILASGKIASVDNLMGDTFELMIPWELIKSKPSDESFGAMISLESRGWKIQVPLGGDSSSEDYLLKMEIDNK